jgi:hypothetical protein
MTTRFAGIALGVLVAALAGCGTARDPGPPRGAEGRVLRPDLPGEWARFQAERRRPPGDELPMDALARAQAQRLRMPGYSTPLGGRVDPGTPQAKAAAARWQWLGPSNIAGRVRTLAFDPRDARRMLAGGVSGGVFESRDGGASWHPLTDDAANLNIGALRFHPTRPQRIYAGTGELYRNSGQPYAAMWGQGILRSLDDGRSFTPLPATASDDFRYVADLEFSAHAPDTLYAATNSGVWRSSDGGDTWTRLLRPVDATGAARYEGCTDLQLVPDAARDVLLASCASRSTDDRYWLPDTILPPACAGPCPAALFRSDDAAGDAGFQPVLSEAGMGRTSLAAAPSAPGTLYALSASIVAGFDRTGDGRGDYDNGLHALFRSTDGGRSWQARLRNDAGDALSTFLLSYADSFVGSSCGFGPDDPYSAGWYNQAIAIDPLDADVVWVAGMEHYRSDDGGASFGKASWWWHYGERPTGVHADQHLLVFDPGYDGTTNRRLYSTNDGGIAVTDDARGAVSRGAAATCAPAGASIAWRELNTGLGTTQFYTGTVSADGAVYLGGLQDNGTLLNRSGGASTDWLHVWGGDGAGVAIDPRNTTVLYASSQNVGLVRSDDGGVRFLNAANGLSDTPIFIMPWLLDRSTPDRLWAGATRLWRSDDRGNRWRSVSTRFGTDFFDRVSALAQSPVDAQRMLVGTARAIHRSAQALSSGASTTWAASAPRAGWVSSLVFDPQDRDVAYATYSTFGGDHVWRSADGGASWQAIDGRGDTRLPDIPVHALAIDPDDRRRLFVGTDLGLYVSTDGGANWASENAGFATVIVESLAISRGTASSPAHLYAFTYGRGAWRAPLSDLDAVAGYRVGPGTSGTFFDPAQTGHGFVLQVVPDAARDRVLVSWFTHAQGEPRWLYGLGEIDGDRVRATLSITDGARFPPDFVPAEVRTASWGDVELVFDSADRARATWSTTAPGFASGSLSLVRLTRPAAARVESPQERLASCHAGSWFAADQPGHGLLLEVLDTPQGRQASVVWYAYAEGRQQWLFGTGAIGAGTTGIPVSTARGAQAPPDFDPASVRIEPWGTLSLTPRGADRLQLRWTSPRPGLPGGGTGSLDLVRASGLRGHACAG